MIRPRRFVAKHFDLDSDALLAILADVDPGEVIQASVIRGADVMLDRIEESDLSLLAQHGPPGQALTEKLAALAALTEADRRIARSMDMPPPVFAAWSEKLWRRSFTAERDARAGDDANAQKRGRITREIKAELAAAYEAHEPGKPITQEDVLAAQHALRQRGLIPGGADHGDH
ncbi:hypothetical protein [Tsukamurella soli]|uniref:Uncharacterized protein n=1 Tax=Tsukamurella soli TaxID=644556 RepID=A0ABP8J2J2_9ACTN